MRIKQLDLQRKSVTSVYGKVIATNTLRGYYVRCSDDHRYFSVMEEDRMRRQSRRVHVQSLTATGKIKSVQSVTNSDRISLSQLERQCAVS